MIKHKFIVALFTLCYLLTACVAEDLQGPVAGSGEGYLVLQLGSVSAEVQSAPLTKAGEKTTLTDLGVTIPSVDAFTITIKDSNGSTVKTGLYESLTSSPIVLPVGTYTVEASHGDDQALQENPYFYGSGSVTITTGSNPISLTPKLANAVITPVITKDLQKHYYDDWTLTATASDKEMTFNSTTNGLQKFYAKAEETISFTFKGTNKAGQQSTTTWTAISSVSACTAYTVQCNPDLSAFSKIQVTAKATHTYDASDYLNGTDVMLNCNLNGANAEAIQTWNVQVMYNGTVIRTYSGAAPNNLTMEQTEGWPYIPQGSTLSASVTLKTEDEIQLTNSSFSSLPLPIFGISVSGETSYSVYKQSGASEANQKDGSSIFNIGSTVKISEGILNNPKYANILPKVTYITDTGQNSGELTYNTPVSDFTGLNWQKHVLTVTASFDGVTVSNSQDCHVTGLPYSAAPPKVQGDHSWTYESKDLWGGTDEYARIGNGGAGTTTLQSPSFHVFTDIPVTISYNCTAVGSYLGGTTFKMYLGNNEIVSISAKMYKEVNNQNSIEDKSMSYYQNYIKCTNSYSTVNPAHSKVYYININYR